MKDWREKVGFIFISETRLRFLISTSKTIDLSPNKTTTHVQTMLGSKTIYLSSNEVTTRIQTI